MNRRASFERVVTGWLGTGQDHAPAVAVAVIVGAVAIVGSFGAAENQPDRADLDALAVVLLLVGPAALSFRRRYPVPVLATVLSATLAYLAFEYPYGPVFASLVIAFFGAITRGHRGAAWIAAGVGVASYAGLVGLGDEPAPAFGEAAGVAAWLLVALVVGEVVRVARERSVAAERAQAEEAARQEGDERLRIAQELHDVLAHNISMINVQAGTALHLLDERPEQARTALAAIKDASSEALDELRLALALLRNGQQDAPRAPTPGLADLDCLVSRAATGGLAVRLEVAGTLGPLPPDVDRAAFRIVQEALTNVSRHARDATATVTVTYRGHEIVLDVSDDGRGAHPSSSPGTGSGIAGMRARAAAFGGVLDAGPRTGGGFRVHASLPVAGRA